MFSGASELMFLFRLPPVFFFSPCILSFMKKIFWHCFFFLFDRWAHYYLGILYFLNYLPFSCHCRWKGDSCQSFGHWRRKNHVCPPNPVGHLWVCLYLFKKKTAIVSRFEFHSWTTDEILFYSLNQNKNFWPLLLLLGQCYCLRNWPFTAQWFQLLSSWSFHSPVIVALSCINPTFLSRTSGQPHSHFPDISLNSFLWTESAKLN